MTDSGWSEFFGVIGNLEIIRADHYIVRSALYGPPHSHSDQFQFAYIVSGSGTVYVDGITYELGPADTMFSRPFQVHASIGDDETLYELFEITFAVTRTSGDDLIPRIATVSRCTTPGTLVPCMERLSSSFAVEGNSPLTRLRLAEMLVILQRQSELAVRDGVPRSDTAMRCHQAVNHIARHYAEPVTVESLAEMVGISPSHFAAVFRQTVGCSPIEMVVRTRLHQAKELLRYSTLPVSAIAGSCGFGSSQYFSRLFRSREGLSPLRFRTSQLQPVSFRPQGEPEPSSESRDSSRWSE